MRTRRKPPSLVSMWMLDVFCCALGCVTLLWLLNTRLAGQERERVAAALADLTTTRQALASTRDSADATARALAARIESLQAQLLAADTERNDLTRRLAAAQADLAAVAANLSSTQDELARKQQAAAELSLQLAASAQSATELQKLLRQREEEKSELLAKFRAAADQLHDLDAKHLALTKSHAEAAANLATMQRTGDELAAARAANRDLQSKLDDVNANLIDLQGDKAKLADKLDKLRIESESRFAGIAMTGRRVAFLVDISGSMKLLDDRTPAPRKWEGVVETLVKVMRSLPELEQFQIILFSSKATYLTGAGWLEYRGEPTLQAVREQLLAVEPKGDTNMYDAFDLAFRLKATGLDTIYLLSDGLPTSGPGLSSEQERSLGERERNDILMRQIRQAMRTQWNPPDRPRVRINSIGFFFENPEVGAFLWALSRENDGSFVGMSRP